MASEISICNQALGSIRGGSINSLDENSVQAQNCKLWYAHCRDLILKKASWGFARKISALAVLDQPVFNWSYTYAYPLDCIHVNNVIPDIEYHPAVDPDEELTLSPTALRLSDTVSPPSWPKVQYQVMKGTAQKIIVSNEPRLRIDYRAKITDPNQFDPTFTSALIHLLSSFLAVPILGVEMGQKMKREQLEIYNYMVEEAEVDNANERHRETPESEFITCRNGS
jgi:hypothetical protein